MRSKWFSEGLMTCVIQPQLIFPNLIFFFTTLYPIASAKFSFSPNAQSLPLQCFPHPPLSLDCPVPQFSSFEGYSSHFSFSGPPSTEQGLLCVRHSAEAVPKLYCSIFTTTLWSRYFFGGGGRWAVPSRLRDLSYPTRDWTCALGSESSESQPLDHQRIPLK